MQTESLQVLAESFKKLASIPQEDAVLAVKILAMVYGEPFESAGEGFELPVRTKSQRTPQPVVFKTTGTQGRLKGYKNGKYDYSKRAKAGRGHFDRNVSPGPDYIWCNEKTRIRNGKPSVVRGHWMVDPQVTIRRRAAEQGILNRGGSR